MSEQHEARALKNHPRLDTSATRTHDVVLSIADTFGLLGTTQVCLFRDAYDDLTKAGLSIYGLSNDSPKANTTFVTKQKLQYSLLCDPKQTLISAIGLKKAPKGTTRGK